MLYDASGRSVRQSIGFIPIPLMTTRDWEDNFRFNSRIVDEHGKPYESVTGKIGQALTVKRPTRIA